MSSGKTLLVTGASGQLGQRVLELLLEAGETHIIATTRTPEKLADFAARGVAIRYASFDEPDSLLTAFAGAHRLLLISTDSLSEPGQRQRQHIAAVRAAAAAGVQHILYTSLTNATDTPILIALDHAATEAEIIATGLEYTILRNNMYADMLPQTLAQAQALGGMLFSAAGDGKIGYVTREDCARAAAAALAATYSGKRILDVTGAEALSSKELATVATTVLGQPITYVPITLEALSSNLAQAGLPPPIVQLVASFDEGALQGKLDLVTTAVEDLTGRKAISVADFLATAVSSAQAHA